MLTGGQEDHLCAGESPLLSITRLGVGQENRLCVELSLRQYQRLPALRAMRRTNLDLQVMGEAFRSGERKASGRNDQAYGRIPV